MNVLAILPGFIPSTIIGILRPLSALESHGEISLRLRMYNISAFASSDINWCDVAIFCRNCEIKDLSLLYELKRKGKKVVYELDDNFEEIPLTTHIGIYHRFFSRLHVLKRFFSLSDITRIYSDRLLQRAVIHGARPQIIRSYFDTSIIDGLSKRAPDGIIRIAYPTGRIDDIELEERIFSAVKRILEKYIGKVEFHLWHKSLPRQLYGVKGVVLNKGIKGYDNFIRSFFQANLDIGLAPGIDTPFFHSKTNNKYREFGGCGIAGVYSSFLPYSNSVVHEHSGLLAGNSTEEWFSSIEQLVLDAELRARIAKNAAGDVFENYSFENAVESWRDCFALLDKQSSPLPEWLPPPKQRPAFAIVNLRPEDKIDRRSLYLERALEVIPGASVKQFSRLDEYAASPFRQMSTASVFIVSDEHDLEMLSALLPISTSAILDVTTYNGDLELLCRHLQSTTAGVPTNFLITDQQSKEFTSRSITSESMLVVDTALSPIIQEFSLAGYPAMYLELAERNIYRARLKADVGRTNRPLPAIQALANRYVLWKGRFETVFTFIKWRFGYRKF